MFYHHTQHGYFHLIMYPIAAAMLIAAWWMKDDGPPAVAVAMVGLLLFLVGFCFQSLTIVDLGDRLQLRFGPLPLFWKSFRYEDIDRAESGTSSVIDGWGIHWVPGRGWTYNLWGFGCAVLHIGRRTIRIGSDEPEQLVSFLRQRIGQP